MKKIWFVAISLGLVLPAAGQVIDNSVGRGLSNFKQEAARGTSTLSNFEYYSTGLSNLLPATPARTSASLTYQPVPPIRSNYFRLEERLNTRVNTRPLTHRLGGMMPRDNSEVLSQKPNQYVDLTNSLGQGENPAFPPRPTGFVVPAGYYLGRPKAAPEITMPQFSGQASRFLSGTPGQRKENLLTQASADTIYGKGTLAPQTDQMRVGIGQIMDLSKQPLLSSATQNLQIFDTKYGATPQRQTTTPNLFTGDLFQH